MSTNNIIPETAQTVSPEVCDKIEKVIEILKEVHDELRDTINDIYLFCIDHTRNENYNHTMYMNSLYNPNKSLERLLGDPVYSKGLDVYCCAITYEDNTPEVHTTAVTMFIPSKWVDNVDYCKGLIVSELCNSMLTHLEYCNHSCNGDYATLCAKVNDIIIASGNVESFYTIKEINSIIKAYNSTFKNTDYDTGISIHTIADELDDLYELGSTFVQEICEINPRYQYEVIQENEYIHIRGLKGKNLYDSTLDNFVELIIPSDMYIKSEEDMMTYFAKYILTQIDNQVYEYKKNMRSFLEKYKHYDRDFSHIMRSLEL